MKILITSVGSLVGQNILDVLEYPAFSRRSRVEIIGTNSIPESPQNFRCDKVYLICNTDSEYFESEFKEILNKEKPDVVLSGRDEDTLVVTNIIRKNNYDIKLPYGSIESLEIALDKVKTSEFCLRNQLPFANTFISKGGDILNELRSFALDNSFPLIAKPIQGYASKGVFFIRNMDELEYASKFEGYMFQEYLGDGKLLESYFDSMEYLVPLFAHAPNITHHSCHVIIRPDGTYDDIFISKNEHNSGVTVGFKRVQNDFLRDATDKYVKAVYLEGGYGPLTVQFRKDRKGIWKAQEMNMRTNGNTFPRFMSGQDDLGEIFNYLYPDEGFPIYESDSCMDDVLIGKVLSSYVMPLKNINSLRENNTYKG